MASFSSRFVALTKGQARLVLLALALAVLGGVLISFAIPISANRPASNGSDLHLYQTIVERLRHGEAYYPVAAEELRNGGYALRPAVNFRLPTLATFIAAVPEALALTLLRTIATLVVLAWTLRLWRTGVRALHALAAGAILFSGVGLAYSEPALIWHEVWAGLLVALALAVHGRRTWGICVALVLCAVLIRELALPLPLILMVLAARERRLLEAAVWLGVVAVFGAAMAVHMHMAALQTLSTDGANAWAAAGGWRFILSTATWNLFLSGMPLWLLAILTPLAILGLAGWNDRAAGRGFLALALWLCAFLFFGRPDNSYWGLMYAPLLALGFALSLPSCLALLSAATLERTDGASQLPRQPGRSQLR
jgi:hypothetical protein